MPERLGTDPPGLCDRNQSVRGLERGARRCRVEARCSDDALGTRVGSQPLFGCGSVLPVDEAEKSAERRRIEFLAEEYLVDNRDGRRHRRHDPLDDGFYEFYESLHRLRRANEVLDFLKSSRRDPYETFADVPGVLSDAAEGLRLGKQVLADGGYLSMLDDHIDTVMRGLDPEGLPSDEAAVLESLGFRHLAQVIRADIDLVASEWRNGTARGLDVAREFRRRPVSDSFDQAIEIVSRHRVEYVEYVNAEADESVQPEAVEPRKERRWWKGLGQIVEGAAIAVADAGMAVGAFKFPVSPEVQTYGAVVSVAGGVGKLMNGLGDLWGE